ncbi:hypothetical protein MANES_09G008101v8 [Manihot esculenta]|uniref:Uncharacterized protein n=1 Tax=Manihot esculenta TaxID=3983 RepID=A0ACB7H190_MANES|nr:hypothetical protein MANES_09G008101v8 [Manihot esculenta]
MKAKKREEARRRSDCEYARSGRSCSNHRWGGVYAGFWFGGSCIVVVGVPYFQVMWFHCEGAACLLMNLVR